MSMLRLVPRTAVFLHLVAAAVVSGQGTATPLAADQWRIDAGHSAVSFRVRHLGMSWVNGAFRQWTGELTYDPDHPENASITVRIQAASVDTENERRDNDVRQNYLEVAQHPELSFVSRSVARAGAGKLRVVGDLTMHGVSRAVTLDVETAGVLNTSNGRRTAFTATTTIRRQDFGIERNALLEGAQVVGDDIRISIDVEATQPVAPSRQP